MTQLTRMRWVLCLALLTSAPLLVTSGNDPTSATSEWEHSGDHVTNYTPPLDVTTAEATGHVGVTTDATVSMATEDPTIPNPGKSVSGIPSAELPTIKDVKSHGTSPKTNSTDDKTSGNQTVKTPSAPTTIELLNSTAHAPAQTDPTTTILQDSATSNPKSSGDVTSTSAAQGRNTSKTTHSPTSTLYTHLRGSASTASVETPQAPGSEISVGVDVNGARENASGAVNGSSSLVPVDRMLTARLPSHTTRPRGTPSSGSTPDVSAGRPDVVTAPGSNAESPPSTESPAVQQTPPDLWSKVTKSTLTTPYTANAATEDWLTTQELEEDGKEKVVFEEDGSHQETAYERSLRTRRVINHAALWITIGFVVVLVSYITVLVIYNRTRPEWQDPQRPYSRFENEAEDFPESNENETENENCVDSENQDLIQRFPSQENRRDFSQCVDSRDFPPCEGDQEYLLYEDPTCMDGDTCTEFTYRDQ